MSLDYRAVTIHEDVLSDSYCRELSDETLNMKDQWKTLERLCNDNQQRWNIGTSSFFIDHTLVGCKDDRTLKSDGSFTTGNYKSARDHRDDLLCKVAETVPETAKMLNKHFPELDRKLEQAYSKILGKPCEFHPKGTKFGFTIQHGWVGEDPGMGWHFDDTARFYVTGLVDDAKIVDQYSFTLAIRTPEYASFEWYEKTLSDYPSDSWQKAFWPCLQHTRAGYRGHCENPECPFEKGEYGELSSVEMKPGTLVLQRGRFYHRPGPSIFKEGQSRITIQCFGADVGNKVWLYR